MLQDDTIASMPAVPPSHAHSRSSSGEMQPAPLDFDMPPRDMVVPPSGFRVDHPSQLHQPGALGQQPGDWLLSPAGTPPPPPQHQLLQPQFQPARSPSAAIPQLQSAAETPWAMGGGLGAASGTWAPLSTVGMPLSTNPSIGSMSNGWLSTGVSECDTMSHSSAGMTHNGQGYSSGSSVQTNYTIPTPSNADGLWSLAPTSQPPTTSTSMAPPAVPLSMMSAGGLPLLMSPMMQQVHKQSGNQMRAEAAPYVPMHTGVPAC